MSNYVLDKSYRIAAANGVGAGLAVVGTANEGECNLPLQANAAGILGITTHPQTRAGRFVSVRRLGIIPAVAAGPIARGDRVCVADVQGRVAALGKPTWNTGTVGAGNALVFRWLDAARFPFNLLLRLDGENDSQSFGWSIGNGELRILLTTNSQGDVTETAAGLITKIAAEATLSRFLSVSHATGSSGAGLLVPVAATPTNLAQSLNPIGVAEGSASAAGDLVEILLTP
jgi:hypothetical protein